MTDCTALVNDELQCLARTADNFLSRIGTIRNNRQELAGTGSHHHWIGEACRGGHEFCVVKSRVLPEMRLAGEPLELIQTEGAQYKLE